MNTTREQQIDQLLTLMSSPLPFRCAVTFEVWVGTPPEAPEATLGGVLTDGVVVGSLALPTPPRTPTRKARHERRLTDSEVRAIRTLHREGASVKALARKFRRRPLVIQRLLDGQTYTTVSSTPEESE